MITITKKYYFYAAHRNQHIDDKCKSLHGHTYRVEIDLWMPESDNDSGVTMLFSRIDDVLGYIFETLDHSLILQDRDPIARLLLSYGEKNPEDAQKIILLPYATSAENLAMYIFNQVRVRNMNVICVRLAETESSIVTYNSIKNIDYAK